MKYVSIEETTNKIPIKEGVKFVFDKNPELEHIGNKEQYSQYVETIFPESKIKDIVFFGSLEQVTSRRNNQHFGSLEAAISRTDFLKQVMARFDKQSYIYPTILNIKNIKRVDDADYNWDIIIEQAKSEQYDGLVYVNNNEGKDKDSYVIFEPIQAHSLGSPQDIE
ncbi:MAG: hypothetical protein LBP53_07615 [Candidatus Peribacteria bacterium]|jgi:hypothetical protein|nr:hypothetical protein [Candidatus Peribacteria bacterium]